MPVRSRPQALRNLTCSLIENLHARVAQILAGHEPAVPESRVADLRRYAEANR